MLPPCFKFKPQSNPMDQISLRHVLPKVFAGAEHDEPLRSSQVWLRDVTFSRGECYMVEAGSGTGKSSLCSYLYGYRRDYTGTIAFDGEDIRTYSIERWCETRRTRLALLPQEMRLFPELTALENVEVKNRLTSTFTPARVADLFDRLGIGAKLHQPARLLSIGQQQRVAIIRALAQPFDFILLDEPVSHLDRDNNRIVAGLILERARELGAGVITTSVGNPLLLEAPLNTISL